MIYFSKNRIKFSHADSPYENLFTNISHENKYVSFQKKAIRLSYKMRQNLVKMILAEILI